MINGYLIKLRIPKEEKEVEKEEKEEEDKEEEGRLERSVTSWLKLDHRDYEDLCLLASIGAVTDDIYIHARLLSVHAAVPQAHDDDGDKAWCVAMTVSRQEYLYRGPHATIIVSISNCWWIMMQAESLTT